MWCQIQCLRRSRAACVLRVTTYLVVCHLHVLEDADRARVRVQPVQPRRLRCAFAAILRIAAVAVAVAVFVGVAIFSALCALGRVSSSVVGHV